MLLIEIEFGCDTHDRGTSFMFSLGGMLGGGWVQVVFY